MKQAITLAGIAVALSSISAAHADKKPYTLADLKALIGQKSYSEAVSHLGDIAPADRNAEWLDVAATAGAGYVGSLSNDNLATKVMAIEALDTEYPAILKAPKYTKARAEIGIKAYEACFKTSYWLDECLQHAVKFVEADPGNAELALQMAKLVRKSANPYVAVPHFKRALAAGKANAAAICKDPDLQSAVIAGLGLPRDYDNASDSRAIASGVCWEQLRKPILEAWIEDSSGGYVRQNSCDFLKAKKALTAEQSRGCK